MDYDFRPATLDDLPAIHDVFLAALNDLNAHTGSGSINLNHPVTVQGTVGRKEVRGKVGSGGVPVEVQTGSGDIRID